MTTRFPSQRLVRQRRGREKSFIKIEITEEGIREEGARVSVCARHNRTNDNLSASVYFLLLRIPSRREFFRSVIDRLYLCENFRRRISRCELRKVRRSAFIEPIAAISSRVLQKKLRCACNKAIARLKPKSHTKRITKSLLRHAHL